MSTSAKLVLLVLGVGLAILLLAFGMLVFLMSGGFERWQAERDVKQRGDQATERVDVDGLWTMRIPRGWRRDEYRESLPGGARYDLPAGTELRHRLLNPQFARAYFSLGRYSEVAGAVVSAQIEVQVPTPDAEPWIVNPPHPPPYVPVWREVQRDAQGVTYVYALATAEDLEKAPQVLYHAEASGVRVEWRGKAAAYSLAQSIELARAMALSVEIDTAAMAAALAEYKQRTAEEQQAAERARTIVREHFGVDAITATWDQAQVLPDGSFLQSTEDSMQITYRVGTLPRPVGADPEAILVGYWLDPERLPAEARSLLPAAGADRLQFDIVAIWRADDGGIRFDDLEGQRTRGYHDASVGLARAVLPTLTEDRLPLYRKQSFAWTEVQAIERALRLSRAIAAAGATDRPVWRERSP